MKASGEAEVHEVRGGPVVNIAETESTESHARRRALAHSRGGHYLVMRSHVALAGGAKEWPNCGLYEDRGRVGHLEGALGQCEQAVAKNTRSASGRLGPFRSTRSTERWGRRSSRSEFRRLAAGVGIQDPFRGAGAATSAGSSRRASVQRVGRAGARFNRYRCLRCQASVPQRGHALTCAHTSKAQHWRTDRAADPRNRTIARNGTDAWPSADIRLIPKDGQKLELK